MMMKTAALPVCLRRALLWHRPTEKLGRDLSLKSNQTRVARASLGRQKMACVGVGVSDNK